MDAGAVPDAARARASRRIPTASNWDMVCSPCARRNRRMELFTSSTWSFSDDAAAASSSTMAAFCWVMESMCAMASLIWEMPACCSVAALLISFNTVPTCCTEVKASFMRLKASLVCSPPVVTREAESVISCRISRAALEVRCANARTSAATTAKPRPASPARAASTAALSARILVWKATPSIR